MVRPYVSTFVPLAPSCLHLGVRKGPFPPLLDSESYWRRVAVNGSLELGRALGHVRNAVVAFVGADDPSGESLFLAAECLDLEGLFAELGVEPELVDPGVDAMASLDAASHALALWARLQVVRARAPR